MFEAVLEYEGKSESPAFTRVRTWAQKNGAHIHESLRFVSAAEGTSVYASAPIPDNAHLVSCPFNLAITPELAFEALDILFFQLSDGTNKLDPTTELRKWTLRMQVCSYLVAHWVCEDLGILEEYPCLRHQPYLDTLPPAKSLTASVTFSKDEMALIQGTNLHAATEDRRKRLKEDHKTCVKLFRDIRPDMGKHFTFDRYLTASIYLSSRAFPSSLLQRNPTAISSDDSPSHPVLLPVLDCLNHARATPVTWLVDERPKEPDASEGAPGDDNNDGTTTNDANLRIVVVSGMPIESAHEVFNNYGAKPNAELILGYGFALQDNPEDTIVIQLGGDPTRRPIGRRSNPSTTDALEGLWTKVFTWLMEAADEDGDAETKDEPELMNAMMSYKGAEMLLHLTGDLESKLPVLPYASELVEREGLRSSVVQMATWYVQGQHEIVSELLEFLREKQRTAEAKLKEMGVDMEDEDEEEEREELEENGDVPSSVPA